MSKTNLTPKQQRALKKRRKKRMRMILLIIEIAFALLIVCGVALFLMPNSKSFMTKVFMKCPAGQSLLGYMYEDEFEENVHDSTVDKEKIDKVDLGEGYTNIALFGIDPRNGEFESQTHTDSIIIVSINNKTSEVKMVSLYRDTLLRMQEVDGGVVYSKANAAFFKNGVEGALSMINNNLDLDITEYALVNFQGLATIIDALGGIDVTLSDKEVEFVNGYLVETREITGMDSPDVEESGFVHLNGLQSTAYCRIRGAAFTCDDGTTLINDYGRTARQRYVLNKILIHAKNAGLSEILKCADEVFKKNNINGSKIMATNMDWKRIQDLISVAVDCNLTGTTGFPYDNYTPGETESYYGYVIPMGLEQNVVQLHDFLFDEKNYQVSPLVTKINDYIINDTGVNEPESTAPVEENLSGNEALTTSNDSDYNNN